MAYYDLLARNELFITKDDTLVVKAWNSVPGQSLTIRTRRRTPQGDIATSENTLALTADRQANTLAISLSDGTLVGVAVHPTVAVQRGQTFVRIGLARGTGNPEQMTLAQDYVTVAAPLGWPGGRISSPTEGPGAIRSITGTNPAAGQEISETVPTNARWRLMAITSTLFTDATAATRIPTLHIQSAAGDTLWAVRSQVTIGASAYAAYSWGVTGVLGPAVTSITGDALILCHAVRWHANKDNHWQFNAWRRLDHSFPVC